MPARSKSQQRLFGMLHAYNKGEFDGSPSLKKKLKEMSKHISDEDVRHFAKTDHKGLPEKMKKESNWSGLTMNNSINLNLVKSALDGIIKQARINSRDHDDKRNNQSVKYKSYEGSSPIEDWFSNFFGAFKRGQIPIPWLTVGDKIKNIPIDVESGEPVFVGMSGADSGSSSELTKRHSGIGEYEAFPGFKWNNSKINPKTGKPINNTLLFRWFDNIQARKAIEQLAKNHPVYTFSESYGGPSMADAISKSKGNVQGLVMYDPVSRGDITIPTNLVSKAVNIQPVYAKDGFYLDNYIASIGGRHPEITGAESRPWYGPQKTTADKSDARHYRSAEAIEKEFDLLQNAENKQKDSRLYSGNYLAALTGIPYIDSMKLK